MADPDNQQYTDDTNSAQEHDIDWEQLRATAVERAAKATRDFCLFMRDLYVPEKDIKLAPEHGWPEINKDSFFRLGKTDAAIEILQKMSYIDCSGLAKYYEVAPAVTLANYTYGYLVKDISEGDINCAKLGLELYDPLPPTCVSLVDGAIYDGRTQFVLDCRFAVVYWAGLSVEEAGTRCYLRMDADDVEDDVEDDGEEQSLGDENGDMGEIDEQEEQETALRMSAAWPVEEFFEMLKTRFTKMEQLPADEKHVISAESDDDNIFAELRAIFTGHGWPNDYRKDECMQDVMRLAEKKRDERL